MQKSDFFINRINYKDIFHKYKENAFILNDTKLVFAIVVPPFQWHHRRNKKGGTQNYDMQLSYPIFRIRIKSCNEP